MGTTAAFAGGAQESPSPYYALSATGGVIAFHLPQQVPVFSNGSGSSTNDFAVGYQVGGSAAFGLGRSGGYDLLLGLSGFYASAYGSSSSSTTLSGTGVVVIPGFSAPGSTDIQLTNTDTASGAPVPSSQVGISASNNGNTAVAAPLATTPGPGGQDAALVSPNGNSFIYSGGQTQVDGSGNARSFAFTGVADSSGGIFIGTGDLTGWQVSTTTTQHLNYAGADVTLALAGQPNSATSVQVYGGPSYRYLSQDNSVATSVNIPVLAGTGVTSYPTYTMSQNDTVNSNYFGGVAGVSLTRALSNTVSVTVGGEGSLYYTHSTMSGQESFTVGGGGPSPYGPQTVTSGGGVTDAVDGVAYALRGQSNVTFALSPSMALSLGGSVDYLSQVARPNTTAPTLTANTYNGTQNGTLHYQSSNTSNTGIGFTDLLALGATASLTGHF